MERRTAGDDAQQDEIDSRFFAIVTDLVGTPTEVVDEQGGIAWHSRSTVWGLTAWNRDATAYTPLRFPGQYDDPETGLHYNVHRHYEPETARYVSSDPLGLAPAANPSAYVTNPYTWMDPEGLIAKGCTENGGWYGGLLPANEKADGTRFPVSMEVNHIPPKAAWKQVIEPGFYIANKPHKKQKVNNGPAIRMERADHKTPSRELSGHSAPSAEGGDVPGHTPPVVNLAISAVRTSPHTRAGRSTGKFVNCPPHMNG